MSWIIYKGEPFQTEAAEVKDEAMTKPYPFAYFRMDDGEIVNEYTPVSSTRAVMYPYPLSYWRQSKYVNEGYPYHEMFKIPVELGAFQDVATLEKVSIPQSVKKIGEFAFAGTSLKKVRIAVDCEYFPTSFPEGCTVEFYGQEVTT